MVGVRDKLSYFFIWEFIVLNKLLMKNTLLEDIKNEALKHAEKYHSYHNSTEIEYQRNRRRIKNPPSKEIKTPEYWSLDPKFNPFFVLKHKKQIANSINVKLNNGTYSPHTPFIKEIPKKSGGTRTITVFQIPDAAVSYNIYKSLLSKNKHRFSTLSYAYRNDRNVHYAIQDISIELKSSPRVFISEFDFSDFFGSINHEFLYEQLDKNGFLISEYERRIIDSFIKTSEKGIPLGTSISLFLANLVCWKLDRRLEAEGLRFARYADDTVIWSNDYSKICKSFEIINEFSVSAGININLKKSEGISLLSKKGMPSEFGKTKEYIEFLGYKLSVEKVSIKNESVRKIKRQINYLLYRNLIYPVKTFPHKAAKIPANGEDDAFVTAIMQIRRYLYGNLTEEKINKYLNGSYKRLSFKGIMSFYPLLDDVEQLKELDKWLISTILNNLKLREKLLLKPAPYRDYKNSFPFNLNSNNIIPTCRSKVIKRKKGLITIPSFIRIYKAIKLGVLNEGIDVTMNPNSNKYSY